MIKSNSGGLIKYVADRCRKKVRHSTQKDATAEMQRMARLGRVKLADAEAYPCEVCGGWHWGHSPWAAS